MNKNERAQAVANFFSINDIFAEAWSKLGPGASKSGSCIRPDELTDPDDMDELLKAMPDDGYAHVFKMYRGCLLHMVIPPF